MDVFVGVFSCTMSRTAHVPAEAVWLLGCDGDDAIVAECCCDRFSILKCHFGAFSGTMTGLATDEAGSPSGFRTPAF